PTYAHPRAPHSSPTRRSSDLRARRSPSGGRAASARAKASSLQASVEVDQAIGDATQVVHLLDVRARGRAEAAPLLRRLDERAQRSEEHTSELQSRSELVCRLL